MKAQQVINLIPHYLSLLNSSSLAKLINQPETYKVTQKTYITTLSMILVWEIYL